MHLNNILAKLIRSLVAGGSEPIIRSIGGPKMKYLISEVQSTLDTWQTTSGVGFNIVNEDGAQIVTFVYLDPEHAAQARSLMQRAIEHSTLITAYGR